MSDIQPRVIVETGLEARIAGLLEPTLASIGFQLVRIRVSGREGCTLQIMAERPNGDMSVDDCAIVSRAIAPILDVEDPIERQYHLEVSSPGIDRPLVRPKDFSDWIGHDVKIETRAMMHGRKRYRGLVLSADDTGIMIRLDDVKAEDADTRLNYTDIDDAKLVLTDELVSIALKRSKAQQAELDDDDTVTFLNEDGTAKQH